jgi:hypothetical protein
MLLMALWFFSLAGIAQNLLKTAENIVWHVPWHTNFITLVCVGLVASAIAFAQSFLPLDLKLWTALIVAWVASTMLTAFVERPSEKELAQND